MTTSARREAAGLRAALDTFYHAQGFDYPLRPFVGESFVDPRPDRMRVALVGGNAYLWAGHPTDPSALADTYESWWAEGYRLRRGKLFFGRAVREGAVVAAALSGRGCFADVRRTPVPSGGVDVYGTNLVKGFLSDASGKRAADVPRSTLDAGAMAWREELEILAQHRALPHVIIGFGRATWEGLWQALHPDFGGAAGLDRALRVSDYQTSRDPDVAAYHHVNLVSVDAAGVRQLVLLVCLAHPAARTRTASRRDAHWWLRQPTVRELVGLAPLSQ